MGFSEFYTPVQGKYTVAQRDAFFDLLLNGVTPNIGKGVNLLDNWYFVGGGSQQQGGGQFPINQRAGYLVVPQNNYQYKDLDFQDVGYPDTYYTVDHWSGTPLASNAYFKIGDTMYVIAGGSDLGTVVPGYNAANTYSIDRWVKSGNGQVVLRTNGIELLGSSGSYSGLLQRMESVLADAIVGQNVTCSILVGRELLSGTIPFSTSGTYREIISTSTLAVQIVNMQETLGPPYIEIVSKSDENDAIAAIKLELGDTQTLARQVNGTWVLNDPPPNFQQELAKCQRYYQIYATQALRPSNAQDCRPTMRINPTQGTISIDGTTLYYNDANL